MLLGISLMIVVYWVFRIFCAGPLFPGFPGVFEWLAGLGAFSQGQGQENETTSFTAGKAGSFFTLLIVAWQ